MRISIYLLALSFSFFAFAQNDAKLANEYYQKGEFEKAQDLYESLASKKEAIPTIFSNYFQLLIQQKEWKSAEKFLKNTNKLFPDNPLYQVAFYSFYTASNSQNDAQKYKKELLKTYEQNAYMCSNIASVFANQQEYEAAIEFYEQASELNAQPEAYALEMAAIYRAQGKRAEMMDQYLQFAHVSSRNKNYVKNLLQQQLDKEEDLVFLEELLLERVQKNPEDELYPELLIWLELQRKNFYAAFIQARALDKRLKTGGTQSLQIARIASDNKAWEDAIEIYQYVMDKFPESKSFPIAKVNYIQAKEQLIKETYPVDTTEVRALAAEYAAFYAESGVNFHTLQAMRDKARLHAYYLDEADSAINILNNIIENRRAHAQFIAECKIDLADIYLLNNIPWEATLLYSQVEKAFKDSPLAHQAKLKNAKLNYYAGDFELAKSHLDILKLATTRDISNDAIFLSTLIQNNTVFDSTDMVMKQYARIELLIFQNKFSDAEQQLNQMLTDYPSHSLTDEIYWSLSSLYEKTKNNDSAKKYLNLIVTQYGTDILADDALYKLGQILESEQGKNQEAMDTYLQFLKAYPGSMYAAEVRVRIRTLRGDFVN